MVATTKLVGTSSDPIGDRFVFSSENPKVKTAGRSSRTLSESIIVALAASRCAFQNSPAIKISQRFSTRCHITKTSEPNEAIRTVKISKLTDDLYSDRFLWFDKFPVE